MFDSFDVNKDGHITSSEVKTVLKKLGQNPTDEEVAEFIKVCDVDKNGTIEFNEFCRYLVELRRKVSMHTANACMRAFNFEVHALELVHYQAIALRPEAMFGGMCLACIQNSIIDMQQA